MGLLVLSEKTIDETGLVLNNFVVTIKAQFRVQKTRVFNALNVPSTVFRVTYTEYYYVNRTTYDDERRMCVHQEDKHIDFASRDDFQNKNIFRVIYARIKEQFTTTVDLDD
jgi:hypothetical protein